MQRGDHAGLPVVAMEDIRLELHARQRVEHRAAEKREPLVFVSAHAVNIRPVEVIPVIDEIIGDALIFERFNAAILFAPAKFRLEGRDGLHPAFELLRDFTVER